MGSKYANYLLHSANRKSKSSFNLNQLTNTAHSIVINISNMNGQTMPKDTLHSRPSNSNMNPTYNPSYSNVYFNSFGMNHPDHNNNNTMEDSNNNSYNNSSNNSYYDMNGSQKSKIKNNLKR